MELFRVLPETLPFVWPAASEQLGPALERSWEPITSSEMSAKLLAQTAQLWIALEEGQLKASAITQLEEDRGIRSIRVLAFAGEELDALVKLLPELENWGVQAGASRLVAETRPGIFRKMQKHGFTLQRYLIAKDLRGRMH
jgi:hypothetical protein